MTWLFIGTHSIQGVPGTLTHVGNGTGLWYSIDHLDSQADCLDNQIHLFDSQI